MSDAAREHTAKARLEWRRAKLREFEKVLADLPMPFKAEMTEKSWLLLEAYAGLLKESQAHLAPDRALIIQAAATICACGLAAKDAVAIARAIVAEVDR